MDVEERLVDRQPLDQRRRVLEDPVDGLAHLGVRGHARGNHDRLRAQATRLSTPHRRADAIGLGLVAGREHHAGTDDHRSPTQAGVVSLLDGRVEGIEVGVQDRSLGLHEHMFAWRAAVSEQLRSSSMSRDPRQRARVFRRARIVVLALVVGYFFLPYDVRAWIPVWLVFLAALGLEVQFFLGGYLQSRRLVAPAKPDRGPQPHDVAELGGAQWQEELTPEEFDELAAAP